MGLTAEVAASLGGSDATHPGDAQEGQGGGSVLPALVYFALALLLFGTVFEAARRCSETTVLFAASLLVPIAAGDLTSYYYVFLVLLAPLAVARFRRMAALLAMVIATQAVVLTGLQGPGLYATQTLVVLCAAGFTIWDMIALRGGSQRAGWSLTRGTPAIEALRAPPERVREAGL